MSLAPRPGTWEKLKPALARWLPLFGYYSAQRIGKSCYHLRRGKVEPPGNFEINAVDHCNLSCLDCNHASPAMPTKYADPALVFQDFSRLAKHCRAPGIRIAGGEPLLHPDFPELLKALRASGISNQLQVVTNGLLLEQLPEQTWELLDAIELSQYPQTALSPEKLQLIRRKADQHQVALSVWEHPEFHVMFALQGTENRELTDKIFRTCWIAQVCGCMSIHEGFVYKCPQSIYISRIVADAGLTPESDGLRISDDLGFKPRLLRFLAVEEPLEACRYCLGSVGRVRPHRLVPRDAWLSHQDHPLEDLVDLDRLHTLVAAPYNMQILKKPLSG